MLLLLLLSLLLVFSLMLPSPSMPCFCPEPLLSGRGDELELCTDVGNDSWSDDDDDGDDSDDSDSEGDDNGVVAPSIDDVDGDDDRDDVGVDMLSGVACKALGGGVALCVKVGCVAGGVCTGVVGAAGAGWAIAVAVVAVATVGMV